MFKFFWINYKKSDMFSYFNTYNNFKNKKNKKIFVTSEDTQKSFYNFKKYDMNLKNSVNSRDIVIQYLFDSKFSVFIIFIKLIAYLLTLLYMLTFLVYLLFNSFNILGMFAFFVINAVSYLTFVTLFVFSFLLFFIVYLLLLMSNVAVLCLSSSLLLLFFKAKPQAVAPLVLLMLLYFFPSSIVLILFIFLKILLSLIILYVILIDHVLLLMGVKLNKKSAVSLLSLLKKINFFFYIFLNQSLNCCTNSSLFLYFIRSSFYFLFMLFKFLFYSCLSLVSNKNFIYLLSQKSKVNFMFFNFTSVNNSQIIKTSHLLKYNYLIMQKLKFQNIKWSSYYNIGSRSLKKNTDLSLFISQATQLFFVDNLDVLQHPETVLYWKNFNKNFFTKPTLSAFITDDMGKNNTSAYIRNVNQSVTSSNLQYSSLLFKKSFQYSDIVNFYLQNKNNLIFNNSMFNYNYKNGLSKKWDQSRYLLLLSDNSYTIVKNSCYFNSQDVIKNTAELSLLFII